MTTGERLASCVATAERLHSDLTIFALEAEDASVKEMFQRMAVQVEDMLPRLKGRLSHIEEEGISWKK